MSSEKKYSLTLKNLLKTDHYKIPVYQRNYDWGKAQIEQLINDIQDFAENNSHEEEANKQTYYLGSLIVHQRGGYFEILDGQQRFTTLSLLVFYLKYCLPDKFSWYQKPNLSFESRPKSDKAIGSLFRTFEQPNGTGDLSRAEFLEVYKAIDSKECSDAILAGFKIIEDVVSEVFSNEKSVQLKGFVEYLLNHVEILRIRVPKNTDVTHYFEVMNNRGEQLEKHEVVKASLLSVVQGDAQAMAVIQKVWLACSDMNRYVQAGFNVQERKAVFGDSAESLEVVDFAELTAKLAVKEDSKVPYTPSFRSELSFEESLEKGKAVKDNGSSNADNDAGRLERFSSVIDFPNFLIHVLRVYLLQKSSPKRPVLDDKELITSFEDCFGERTDSQTDNVKEFIFTLLKVRYLFDRFVVKREHSNKEGSWSLKRYKLYSKGSSDYVDSFNTEKKADESEEKYERGDTVSCLMLLSAFHVSYPTSSRKNWLSAVLYGLIKQEPTTGKEYLVFLESLAKSFMVNRYLIDSPKEYLGFMYSEQSMLASVPLGLKESGYDFLNVIRYGKAAVFVFNYLDYLLWREQRSSIKQGEDFKFSFKSSVEHFSPQTPRANKVLKEDDLHSFGNLCLMANTDNSSLGNSSPREKSGILEGKRNSMAPLSLKLELMMQQATGEKLEWDSVAINTHGNKMLDVIKKELGLTCG